MTMRFWAMAAMVGFVGCDTGSIALPGSTLTDEGVVGSGRVAPAEGGAGTGLPCDIEALLTAHCTSCHGDPPSPGPIALVTRAHLLMPSKSDPSKSVAELAGQRIESPTRPMPPSMPLSAADIAVFRSWVGAGAPAGSCASQPEPDAPAPPDGPECVLASDCPGTLVCRNGVCDLECITDKDCTPTWTCHVTRCTPPGGQLGGETTTDADAGSAVDAAPPPPVTYNDFASASSWATIDLGNVAAATGYEGSAFDGRYVYFAPANAPSFFGAGRVLRYDTQSLFGSAASWSTFDLTSLDAAAKGYRGAVFDGRFVYFVPKAATGIVPRLDTRESFLTGTAWTTFDLTSRGIAFGFAGATFDGRYLYLVPTHGITVRYDTRGSFTAGSSWSTFDMRSLDRNAYAYEGAVYDGRFIYYVPWGHPDGPHGLVVRFDTHSDFAIADAWTTLDLTTLDPRAKGFSKAAFDGRYVYMIPGYASAEWAASTVARLDTQAAFEVPGAWTFFDARSVNAGAAGFNGASFDGRYLTFAPGFSSPSVAGLALRYDTSAALGSSASWSTFDATTLSASAVNLRGSAFDGKYVYLTPSSGVAVRFDARSRRETSTLPSYYGSFY